ncbi:hypothetical protein M5K25_013427 [Dendrobium thyrsiflorum]|uniref:CCHC-type domain-containing protein n=1 Tax=Dendrobium thyrsiflorum TaxID=117978 RepID=A0ABD0V0B9_DENTH
MLMGGGSFICIFSSSSARDAVLNGGPWNIYCQLIGLSKWFPSFNPDSFEGLVTPIWVRLHQFPSLPLIYWDKKNITRIASMIGRPLWFDEITNEWGKSSYARVCVCLDISKQLPKGVWIQGIQGKFFQKCEFEEVPLLCYGCGLIGHKQEKCPINKSSDDLDVAGRGDFPINSDHAGIVGRVDKEEKSMEDDSKHPWVVVKRKSKPIIKRQANFQEAASHGMGSTMEARKRWRLKGSTFSVGERSGTKPVPARPSVASKLFQGIYFRDPLLEEQPREVKVHSSLKGKEVISSDTAVIGGDLIMNSKQQINLKKPLTWLSGYYGTFREDPELFQTDEETEPWNFYKRISSLKFGNEEETYGPFGCVKGTPFLFRGTTEIVGFHGCSNDDSYGHISAMGVYFKTEAVGVIGQPANPEELLK